MALGENPNLIPRLFEHVNDMVHAAVEPHALRHQGRQVLYDGSVAGIVAD